MKNFELSVVICTYNRASSLLKTLTSLTSQTYKNFEVVIIDGGSSDETLKTINSLKGKLDIKTYSLISSELAKARDLGWRKACGTYVSWIDDDVVVSPNWAFNIIKIFKNNLNIAGVSGPTLIDFLKIQNRDVFFFYHKTGVLGLFGKFWNWFFLEKKMYLPGQLLKSGAWTPGSNFKECLTLEGLIDVDYLEACNMTLRKKLIEKIKGFDLGYKGIAEWSELDLAIRVKNLGYRLVFSKDVLVHHNISSSGAYKRRPQAYLRMQNFYKFYFTHIFKFKLNYLFKFFCYVQFLNIYWVYKFIKSKNPEWLGGLIPQRKFWSPAQRHSG